MDRWPGTCAAHGYRAIIFLFEVFSMTYNELWKLFQKLKQRQVNLAKHKMKETKYEH